MAGIHSILEIQGIAARLQHTRFTQEEVDSFADDVGVSNVILLGGVVPYDFVQHLRSRRIPFVVAESHLQFPSIDAVMADVERGMRMAVEHVIVLGCQHIALVNGPMTTVTSIEKLDGYCLALTPHDLSFEPMLVVNSDFSTEDGYHQTLKLLEQVSEVGAVVFVDDTIAVGGLRALREKGRRMPDDIAIVGFGDYDIAHYTESPLSSAQFDIRQMGVIAARRLLMFLILSL